MKPWAIASGLAAFGGLLLLSKRAAASDGWGSLWIPERDPEPERPMPIPPLPSSFRPREYISAAERDRRFGPLAWFPAPTASNPEAVTIANDFVVQKLVRQHYPNLPGSPTISIHRDAARPLELVLDDLERAGELGLIRSFEGVWNPRLVRGGSTLSSHAYGTSIDVNAGENPLGSPPTDDQKRLAEFFEDRGWYWGDRFSRRDPMHFEWIEA